MEVRGRRWRRGQGAQGMKRKRDWRQDGEREEESSYPAVESECSPPPETAD